MIKFCLSCHSQLNGEGDHVHLTHCVRDELKKLREENKKLKFMVDNGLGYEDLEQDSMQSHIN